MVGGGLQTVLATKTEHDVRKQSVLAMLLLLLRWAFGAAIAALAIDFTQHHPNVTVDPERVVPFVLSNVVPSGILSYLSFLCTYSTFFCLYTRVGYRGCIVASLLAAALTTFDSTINGASSYWTIDIYQAMICPKATPAQLVLQARVSTVVIVLLGWGLSLGIGTINRIWGFMTIAMGGGVVYPYFLSWYWARFNGVGCAAGLCTGVVSASAIFLYEFIWGFEYFLWSCTYISRSACPHLGESHVFLWASSASGVVSVAVAWLTPPTAPKTLNTFYKHVRPPGLWAEVSHTCFQAAELTAIAAENAKDLGCSGLLLIVQVATYVLAVSVVLKVWPQSGVLAVVLAVLLPAIYYKWYLPLDTQLVSHEPLLLDQDKDAWE
ncbi:hypothetical protein DYB26_005306 [Aphanomyces astaci]|uniref:Uncharacterized protein n=1 Tax=Aphanomyces astaci TaxID=112090 RepID=A0A418DWG6_APHAT|nr:hypothetical protein DYB26_005306 [Aphanomyces astaci]